MPLVLLSGGRCDELAMLLRGWCSTGHGKAKGKCGNNQPVVRDESTNVWMFIDAGPNKCACPNIVMIYAVARNWWAWLAFWQAPPANRAQMSLEARAALPAAAPPICEHSRQARTMRARMFTHTHSIVNSNSLHIQHTKYNDDAFYNDDKQASKQTHIHKSQT